MTDLKPCPFCGNKTLEINHIVITLRRRINWFHVYCFQCRAHGPDDPSERVAAEQWNTRPVEGALMEACEAMMTHLEDYPPQFYEKGRDDGRDYCIKQARAAIARARGEA
jgi:Lar family restriction alleviation protein